MPTPADVWAVLDPLIGLGEQPDGSNNAPPVTDWYGWAAAWCAMTESYGLAHAGFSDDGGATLNLSRLVTGLVQTTAKGWAYVPYLEDAFTAVGRFDQEPREGDLFITAGQSHTGLVWRVNSDGTVNTIEGNYGNRLVYGLRRISDLRGFCHPPYDMAAPSVPVPPAPSDVPAFPGITRRGSSGEAVRALQRRLAERGWRKSRTITVDGDFGAETDGIVHDFQGNHGLEVDGDVGPITWMALWGP
ncbi:MAG: peptidoglycan-binding protein [Actinomycetota bacterium]|nr:peptidoglycan-binding protein [Actinomycetota bacterium]